jgi:hypothetical protein
VGWYTLPTGNAYVPTGNPGALASAEVSCEEGGISVFWALVAGAGLADATRGGRAVADQTIELAQAAEEIGLDGARVRLDSAGRGRRRSIPEFSSRSSPNSTRPTG